MEAENLTLESLSLNATRVLNDIYYCPVCSAPPEYCAFGPSFNDCKLNLKSNNPQLFSSLYTTDDVVDAGDTTTTESAPQKSKKTKAPVKKQVLITTVERTKRKRVVHVTGLELFDVDLKKAAKLFANKFAASSNVTKLPSGSEEIIIQGDCSDDLFEFILEKFPQITEDELDFGETKKK
ncbi:translation initiation factor SUI1 [Globomyces pollinis-pini]|nr:translation initiation factor SUI1 [Globomyces pollinis-pini]